MDEDYIAKRLKIILNPQSIKPNPKEQKEQKEQKEPTCNCTLKFQEINQKFNAMIELQTKLIALLEDIDYRFNDKGQMLSYIR